MKQESQKMFRTHAQDDNKSQTSTLSIQQFGIDLSIMPEDGVNQILQISLSKDILIYFRGQIVYSNVEYPRFIKFNRKIFQMIKSLIAPQYYSRPISQFQNKSEKLAVLAIKRMGGGGKIIVIDSSVYGRDMYVSSSHIILSNIDQSMNGNSQIHQKLKHLSRINLKEGYVMLKTNNQSEHSIDIHVLQANKDSTIMQKCLGIGQQFYLPHNYTLNNILAVEGSVKVTVSNNVIHKLVKFEGPGWLFFQVEPKYLPQRIMSLTFALTAILMAVIFQLILLGE